MVGIEFHSLTQYDQNKSGMTASEPVSLTILIGSSETQLHNREWFVRVVHTVNIANVAHGVCYGSSRLYSLLCPQVANGGACYGSSRS